MTFETILVFAGIVFVIAMIPGPNALLVLFTALTRSRLHAFFNVLGVSAGFLVHAIVSAQGLSLILAQSEHAFMLLKWLGVGYLLYLGVSHLRAGRSHRVNMITPANYQESNQNSSTDEAGAVSKYKTKLNESGSYFIRGFLTNMLNPKIVLFYVSIFPQFVSQERVLADSMVLGGTQAIVVSLWFILVILLATQLKSLLLNTANVKWLNYLTAGMFFGFGVKLATTKL